MKINSDFKFKKGFTLLELIIVIIIIGILASVAIPQYINVSEKARAAEGDNLLGLMRSSQMRYYLQYAAYTATLSKLDIGYTTPKYFTVSVAAADPIATVTRNGTARPASFGAYLIKQTADGTITCTDGTAGDCAKIGH